MKKSLAPHDRRNVPAQGFLLSKQYDEWPKPGSMPDPRWAVWPEWM
ncbi:MAG: hypothetical protein JW719_09960 [Pirellulales bacterium]|nr:hypothetical protein [Pirellulales bacterium]